MDRCR